MRFDVPLIQDIATFPGIPSTVKLAIILPTVRWSPTARAVLGAMVGVANEEVAVLVADNSENHEKREFLNQLRNINPYLIAISHNKNIGGKDNLFYLFDWSKDIEFVAQMGDDDWMSPAYHADAYKMLLDNPNASCAEVGTTLVDIGDGNLVNVSQPNMNGPTPLERIGKWDGIVARATMYNTSRRNALEAALKFLKATPLPGLTMGEDLWELNRLACGDFLRKLGPGCLIHYPTHGSILGDPTQRYYNAFCKDIGLQFPFVFFLSLSTAIQCAVFLIGNLSPILNLKERAACGQLVFRHIFSKSFLPRVSAESSQAAAMSLFANSPSAMAGFLKYCTPPFTTNPVLDRALIDWFVEIIRVFEATPTAKEPRLSDRFVQFIDNTMSPDIQF